MSNAAEKAYLRRLLSLGCIICGASAVPHHVREQSLGAGTGCKVSDYDAIPLCDLHHTTGGYGIAYHAGEKEWEKNFGTQLELLTQVQAELGHATRLSSPQ